MAQEEMGGRGKYYTRKAGKRRKIKGGGERRKDGDEA